MSVSVILSQIRPNNNQLMAGLGNDRICACFPLNLLPFMDKEGKTWTLSAGLSHLNKVSIISGDVSVYVLYIISSNSSRYIPPRILYSFYKLKNNNIKIICMVLISFIYDPPFFWFHVHTVINQHASLWWYQFATSCDSCDSWFISFGILEGAMHSLAQLHLGEYFATGATHHVWNIKHLHDFKESWCKNRDWNSETNLPSTLFSSCQRVYRTCWGRKQISTITKKKKTQHQAYWGCDKRFWNIKQGSLASLKCCDPQENLPFFPQTSEWSETITSRHQLPFLPFFFFFQGEYVTRIQTLLSFTTIHQNQEDTQAGLTWPSAWELQSLLQPSTLSHSCPAGTPQWGCLRQTLTCAGQTVTHTHSHPRTPSLSHTHTQTFRLGCGSSSTTPCKTTKLPKNV